MLTVMDAAAVMTGDDGDGGALLRQWMPHRRVRRAGMMRVQLVRKLADQLDGVDVSGYREGDVLDVTPREAELLIAERWALPFPARRERRYTSCVLDCANAADAPCSEPRPQRRAEDRLRDELHDRRARIVKRDE